MSQQFNASPDKLTGAVNILPPTSKLLLTGNFIIYVAPA
jgi:hypothetical protein